MRKRCLLGVIILTMLCGLPVSAKDYSEYKDYPVLSEEYLNYYIQEKDINVYKFSKQKKALEKFEKKINLNDAVPIVKTKKGYYKKTDEGTSLMYVGGMKKNRPHGKGIMYQLTNIIPDENGDYNIFGNQYSEGRKLEDYTYAKLYEGNFKNGEVEGFGIRYYTPDNQMVYGDYNNTMLTGAMYEEVTDDIQENIRLTVNPILYEGMFKDGAFSGKGNSYAYTIIDMEQAQQDILYGGTEEITETDGEYIFPDSDKETLTLKEIIQVSDADKQMGINEIYARHGRMFNDPEIQDYFDSKSWYKGTIQPEDFDDTILNNIEKQNIDMIKQAISNTQSEDTEVEYNEYGLPMSKDISVVVGTFKDGQADKIKRAYIDGQLVQTE